MDHRGSPLGWHSGAGAGQIRAVELEHHGMLVDPVHVIGVSEPVAMVDRRRCPQTRSRQTRPPLQRRARGRPPDLLAIRAVDGRTRLDTSYEIGSISIRLRYPARRGAAAALLAALWPGYGHRRDRRCLIRTASGTASRVQAVAAGGRPPAGQAELTAVRAGTTVCSCRSGLPPWPSRRARSQATRPGTSRFDGRPNRAFTAARDRHARHTGADRAVDHRQRVPLGL